MITHRQGLFCDDMEFIILPKRSRAVYHNLRNLRQYGTSHNPDTVQGGHVHGSYGKKVDASIAKMLSYDLCSR